MRWATVILNALKMMKLPTKSAMAAKPRRKLRKMSTNCLNWSLASLEAVSPVMASYPAGSTVWILRASAASLTPGSAVAPTVAKRFSESRTRCAVAVVKAVSVAPARLFSSPKATIPTSR